MIDYKQIREEIFKKIYLLISFDGYINSEKFDKDIYKLIDNLFNIFKIDLLEEQLIELKHEITNFLRDKYYGVK